MFTEEQKIRAIELYFKYGKKLAPVVRELGYPSKRNLRRWIRSWEAGGGAKESIRHKHRYSDEQKQVAVEPGSQTSGCHGALYTTSISQ